ncbi:MAG: MerR family transcriptional regulator, partial [Acetobacteraceae bacterium]
MQELLTIGEFAARCGLSRGALRFYDQNQLLRPQLVDDQTGYRYYAVEQLDEAALVRRLRAAEMPVGVLRQYLAATAEYRKAILDAHRDAFRERASAVEAVVDELRRDLDAAVAVGAGWCSVEPAGFAAALQQVSFAIADPEVRAELGAVWVETKEGALRVVATDSYRLAVRDLVPERIGQGDLRGVIDAAHVRALELELRSASRLVISQDSDGVISATIDGRCAVVGNSGDGFPDYEMIVAGLPSGHQIALPRDLLIDAVTQLPSAAPHLRLSFGPQHLALEALGHQARLDGSWLGAPLQMFVDLRFFTEAAQATVGPDLVIEASDPLQPITLRSADTGTFSVLTMP